MQKLLLITLFSLGLLSFTTDKPAYRLFDAKGQAKNYADLLKTAAKADIVFFGELHNNPIAHWLQLELTQDLFTQKQNQLLLGAEMFEADNQLVLTEYLNGLINEKNFETECRLWDNYKTDYKPLINFAKQNQLNFVATNIPRRYASIVSKRGLDALNSLPIEAQNYIAPLPIKVDLSLPGYAAMLDMGSNHDENDTIGNDFFPKAQAIKDATMAHFILKNWEKNKLFLHFNGAYHSNNYEGIVWYLKQANPKLNIVTISSTEQNNIDTLEEENKNVADFIIAIPTTMTKTY